MSPGRLSSGLGFPPGGQLSDVLCSVLQLQLSPVELSELHADLKLQERDEFSWKKLKAEGLDEDGEKEAKLIRNLNGIFPFVHTRGQAPGAPSFSFGLGLWAGQIHRLCGPQRPSRPRAAAQEPSGQCFPLISGFPGRELRMVKYRSRGHSPLSC